MKALILDGSSSGETVAGRIDTALKEGLQGRGWDVKIIAVREQRIGNCAGDFFCWIRNPGICNVNDDNRVIAAEIVQSDLLVYLTPVTFGGYSSVLKQMVDHQIQNILPFFTKVNGEVHHEKRYPKYPSLLVIGWMNAADEKSEAVFRYLAHRNAINLHSRSDVCGVLVGQPADEELRAQIERWLEASIRGAHSPAPLLSEASTPALEQKPPRRALLLVGSPRIRKSSSAALGGYLMQQLGQHGVENKTLYVHTIIGSQERTRQMLEAVDEADLVVLAFPLYVDALPAPLTKALEKVAAYRAGKNGSTSRLVGIVNSGFPEASHNDSALAICEAFARQAGFEWAGGLALGGGQGLVHGTPLEELNGSGTALRQSLEIAAEALANGQAIPRAAVQRMRQGKVPRWLYILVGAYGWRQQARQYGMQNALKRRPYAKGRLTT